MAGTSIPLTFGALLLGGLYASLYVASRPPPSVDVLISLPSLSGLVLIQVVIYFKMYPRDPSHTKGLVCLLQPTAHFQFSSRV